ncbi:MAG: secretin N-terminal domain-containing protein [Candidatus Sumerlaeia bacterium]
MGITVMAVALGAAATLASAASITKRSPADVEIAQLAAPRLMVADSAALTTSTAATSATAEAAAGDGMMSFNFRGASLDTVLDYMSKAGGFVIVRSVNVDGRVDVVSHQPLNRAEAVELLNTVLNEKGYSAIRNGRVLKIVSRDDARTNNIPVKKGNDPEKIPSTDEMITQIIPVRYADATAMLNDIQQLLPSWATATANVSSNSIVLTDTQANVQRIAQIVKALDTSISEITTIRVYMLKFADATEVTNMINNLFTTSNSSGNRNNMRGGMAAMFQARFGGGMGGPGGQGGMGGMGQQQQDSQARQAASRVLAVADTRTNAVVVSAPEELHQTIAEIVTEVDRTEELQTQIQVFPLQFADATEMTDLITNMYKDTAQTAGATSRNQFGGGRFPGGMQGMQRQSTAGAGGSTQRQLQQKTVTAVADTRTNSVIVIAVDSVLQQVAQVISNLDKDPAGHQKVFVYQLHNADGEQVSTMLQDMFQNGGTTRRSTSSYSSTNRSTSNYNNSSSNRSSNRNSSGNYGSSNRSSNYGSSYGSSSSSYNRSGSSRY